MDGHREDTGNNGFQHGRNLRQRQSSSGWWAWCGRGVAVRVGVVWAWCGRVCGCGVGVVWCDCGVGVVCAWCGCVCRRGVGVCACILCGSGE